MRSLGAVAMFALVMVATRPAGAQAAERDRLLNCYYDARTRDAGQARTCLEQLLRESPQDTQALLELGYFEIAQQHPEAAIEAFDRAVAAGVKKTEVFAQLGYLHLARGEREAALGNFRAASELDPANEQLRMQSAYLLDSLGCKREAVQLFQAIESGTTDDARRVQACRAAEVLAPLAMKQLPAPYFLDIYTAPDWYSNIDVATLPLRLRAGAALGPGEGTDIYGQVSILRDDRSSETPLGPVIYFDNVLTVGPGVTTRIAGLPGLSLTATVGAAYDLLYQDRDRWRFDLRAGGEYYNAWGVASRCPAGISAPFRPVLEVYATSFYFSRYSDVISTLRLRPGLRVLETAHTSLDLNLHLAGVLDTAGVDYNNLLEIGVGLILAPDRRTGLRFGLETVRREFQGGQHDVVTRARIEYSARL